MTPYLGKWVGTETEHATINGKPWSDERSVFWNVDRLGGLDIIMFEHGTRNSAPRSDFFDVLTYDPSMSSYRMFLAGYRLFTGNESTSELVRVDHEANGTLIWSTLQASGYRRQTSLRIDNGTWHEKVEDIGTDGSTAAVSDATLVKQ